MRQRLSCLLGVVSLVAAATASADAPAIEHQPVACVAAGKFPRLEARFAPAESVARARVQFQAEGTRHWYGVAMTRGSAGFSAVLPQPKKSLKSYRYYVEVTDTALGTGRTSEYITTVVARSALCTDLKKAEGLASAAVRLEVPAGAPAVPGGFSSTGLIAAGAAGAAVAAGAATGAAAAGTTAAVAAGGGIPAALIIGGGVVAVGAGAAVVATRGDGEGGGDSRTTYRGEFSGQFVVTQIISSGNTSSTCLHTRAFTGAMTVVFEQANSPGRAQISTTETFVGVTGSPTCSGPGPSNFMGFFCDLGASLGNLACRDEITSTSSGGRTSTVMHAFSGALSGGVISGTITFAFTGQASNPGNTVTDSASTSFPVTLR